MPVDVISERPSSDKTIKEVRIETQRTRGVDPSWELFETATSQMARMRLEPSDGSIKFETNDGIGGGWVGISVDPTGILGNVDAIDFDLTPSFTPQEGRLGWDADDGTLKLGLPGGNVNLQVGQESLIRVTNKSGADILDGKAVYADGAQGNRPTIALADNTDSDKIHLAGITTEAIANNSSGYITINGLVRDIDTSGTPYGQTWLDGDKLYLSTAGGFSNVHPTSATAAVVIVAYVTKAHATEGHLLISAPETFTLGNNYDGVLRTSVINKNAGTSASCAFTAVNDANHRSSLSMVGSNYTTVAGIAESLVIYNQGYNKTVNAVDGNHGFEWWTDVTDVHTLAATPKMMLSASGALTLIDQSADPPTPAAGYLTAWVSDGTGTGVAGDLLTIDDTGTITNLMAAAGGSGDVVGPASATDNAIVRYDGTTGKLVQNSGVTIDDSDLVVAAGFHADGGGTNSCVYGDGAGVDGDEPNCTSIGVNAICYGDDAVAIGYGAAAGGSGSTTYQDNVAIGSGAASVISSGVAIGKDASTGTSSGSTVIGALASVTGNNSVAIGAGAIVSGPFGVAIGQGVSSTGSGVTIGKGAAGDNAIGYNADSSGHPQAQAWGTSAVAGALGAVAMGYAADAGHSGAICIGDRATSTAAYQLVIGSDYLSGAVKIDNVYIGEGVTSASPDGVTINSTGGEGTDIAGSDITIAGGRGTGSADGGDVVFQGSIAGITGTTLRSLVERGRITSTGEFTVGVSNTAAGTQASATGGSSNDAGGDFSHVGGGRFNTATATDSVVAGGYNNDALEIGSTICGGTSNAVSSDYGFIGGGNANVISSIGNYCAIVSGNANTITSTGNAHNNLICGGGSNTISSTDDYNAIVGGQLNVASGTSKNHMFVGGGASNEVSADHASICGGELNVASGDGSHIGGGHSNAASGIDSCVPGGLDNEAAIAYSVAMGRGAKTRNKGEIAQSAQEITTVGDAQVRRLVLFRQTTDATPVILTDDGANDSAGSWTMAPGGTLQAYRVVVIGKKSDDTDVAKYTFDGLVHRYPSNPILKVSNASTDYEDNAAWDCTVTGGSGGIKVTVTGAASTTINWVAMVELVETDF